jgi:hypothetical protein
MFRFHKIREQEDRTGSASKGRGVAQIMYIHGSKCKNDKIFLNFENPLVKKRTFTNQKASTKTWNALVSVIFSLWLLCSLLLGSKPFSFLLLDFLGFLMAVKTVKSKILPLEANTIGR